MSYLQLEKALKEVTENVWNGLGDAYQYDISFGETTISDMLLLYLRKLQNPNIAIEQTKQNEESQYGTDWVLWIGSNSKGWIAYAIQAKKYSTRDDRYHSLKHDVKGVPQINILEAYANLIGAIPLYALYNHVENPNIKSRIFSKHAKDMCGVTLTSLNVIRESLAKRGCRNFKFINDKAVTIILPDIIKQTKNYLEGKLNNKNNLLFNASPKIHRYAPVNGTLNKTITLFNSDDKIEIEAYTKRYIKLNIDEIYLD